MRVVFDTNVWVSYFRFGGVCERVVVGISAKHTVWHSQFVAQEVERVLRQKFRFEPRDLQASVGSLSRISRLVHPTGPVPTVCRDPDDNLVLHLCQHVGVELLVTGDNDLRVLGQFGPTQILSPAEVGQRWGL